MIPARMETQSSKWYASPCQWTWHPSLLPRWTPYAIDTPQSGVATMQSALMPCMLQCLTSSPALNVPAQWPASPAHVLSILFSPPNEA